MCNRDRAILCGFPASWINNRLEPLESMFDAEAASVSVRVEVGDSFESETVDEVNLLSTPRTRTCPDAGAGAAPSTSGMEAVPSRDLSPSDSDSSLVMVRLARNFLPKLTLESRPTKNFDCLATKYVVRGLVGNKREIVPLREIFTCTLKNAEAAELVEAVSLWSLEGIDILDATKEGGLGIGSGPSLLLMQMADSNAWGPAVARTNAANCQPFYIPDPSTDDDCQALLQRRLIKQCPDSPHFFVITTAGRESLRMKLSAGNQRSLDEFQRCFGISAFFLLHHQPIISNHIFTFGSLIDTLDIVLEFVIINVAR